MMKKRFILHPKRFLYALFCALMILFVCCASGRTVYAGHADSTGRTSPRDHRRHTQVDYRSEYEAILYGTGDGLASAELNAVAQTPDGYIWAGTYSGLYRYDGTRFEKIQLDERISSVMVLYVDAKGILWIGTNDSGLCRYDPMSGELRFYTKEDGLCANAIRSLCANDRGDLYVGTVADLSVIPAGSEQAEPIETEEDISGVRSMCHDGAGVIAGVSNGGTLFFIRERRLFASLNYPDEGVYYAAVGTDSKGHFLAGTSGSLIERFRLDGEEVVPVGELPTEGITYYNCILFDPATGGFFLCGDTGVGYLSPSLELTMLTQEHFNSSVSDVIIDYQGNIWFVSNKHGMMKYSRNPFVNVFVRAGLSAGVVNCLLSTDQELYIGMDDGMAILDKNTGEKKESSLSDSFKGIRIRHLMQDKTGNIWVSTYGKVGLVRISPSGEEMSFSESEGTIGGRFRYAMELSDGSVLAASNMGLNYIEGDRVTKTLSAEDGLPSAQILTMVENADGSVTAGSDGDGIYYISEEREVIDHKGSEEGLGTLVVLRIVPCGDDGCLYVTSNSLYYDDGRTVKKLNAFPYSNNYDIYITPENMCWISSSAGIFIVHLEDLIANGEYRYTLLDSSRGFDTSLTANAWNTLTDDKGTLLLCCTDGARQISTTEYDSFDEEYYIRISRMNCDDTDIEPQADGTYVIPAKTRRIQIQASVLNYTLSNPLVRIFLEGASDEGITVNQNKLTPLSYTNLPYGDYTLHVQTIDLTDDTLFREETFPIRKQARITEYRSFRITMGLLCVMLAGCFVWWFLRMTVIRSQYEQIKEARDEAQRANSAKSRFLANMSHEIRTPINTIMGMDEMILREKVSPEVAGYAQDIRHASESLLGLVNDILDLSKIESGKMNLVEQEYDTVPFIRGLTTMILVKSAAKDLTFHTDIDPDLPRRLYGDDGKIRQVILNLLTNAVKYTEKGSFTLTVKVVERAEDTVRIHYSVKDTGIGVKPEDMDKLFSAFERLEEKRNSGIQGTGLGLDISRQFVALMGGELRCESVYGEGSDFYFDLVEKIIDGAPIGEYKQEKQTAHKKEAYVPLFVAPEARILAVDDNRMNLQVLSGLLKATKVQIDKAMSGAECLKLLKENSYDVLLLDHMMPEMDGVETLHALREFNTTIPVVALTANAVSGVEEYYLGEGFQAYLTKPVDGRKMEETLLKYLPADLVIRKTEQV